MSIMLLGTALPQVAGGSTSLTASGPVTISTNGQVVEDLDITAGTGVNAITVNNGIINWTVRRCRIRHNLGGRGIFAAFNCTGGTVEDVDIENVHHTTLTNYAGYASPDANANMHIAESGNLIINRARLVGGSSGIYLQGKTSPHTSGAVVTNIECRNVKGVFPRGQILQASFWDDVIFTDFSCVNDPNHDRGEDLFNFFDCARPIVRRGLTRGGASPSGTGGLFESGCTDGLMEDLYTDDPYNLGFGSKATAVAQSHGNILRRLHVQMGYTPYERWQDTLGRRYPASANLTSQDASGVPTTGPLIWNPGGTTLYELCSWHYLSSSYQPTGSPLPLNLLFPSGNASYVTSQAVDLAFAVKAPPSPVSLTMPWE